MATDDDGNGHQVVVRKAVDSALMAWVSRSIVVMGIPALTGVGGWIGTTVLGHLKDLAARHEKVGNDVVGMKHDLELLKLAIEHKVGDQERSITELQTEELDHEGRLRTLERPQVAVAPPPSRPRPLPVAAPPAPPKPSNFLDGLFH
jgi:hypothetical protein